MIFSKLTNKFKKIETGIMKIITGKLFSHKGDLKIPYVQNHHHNQPSTPKFGIATLDSSNVIPRQMLYFRKPKFEIGSADWIPDTLLHGHNVTLEMCGHFVTVRSLKPFPNISLHILSRLSNHHILCINDSYVVIFRFPLHFMQA